MKIIIQCFLLIQFLGFGVSSLFGQDVYTRLRKSYQSGEIDQEDYSSKIKSLYFALQSGKYSPEAGETTIKCLFPIQVEAFKHLSSFEKSAQSFVQIRPVSQATYKTDEGHFKIHYDTTGIHTVDTTNQLGNEVPDWIFYTGRAYERGWDLLMDSLGYQVPPVDTIDGDEIDVFIRELSGVFYGSTFSVNDTGFAQNVPNITYVEMDNDYSESAFFSHGLDGMRVTAIHELFHVFQLGYTFRSNDIWFYELTATWMEDVGYDAVNDYVQWIEFYYADTETGLNDFNTGVNKAVFGKFIEENYDAHVFRGAWEKMLTNKAEISLDLSLKENSEYEPVDGLKAAFGKFALWNWFTGSRKIPGAFFEEGALYPEMEADIDTTFSNSVLILPLFGLEELSFRINRFIPINDSRMKARFTAAGNSDVWSTTLTTNPPDITFLNPGTSVNLNEVSTDAGLIIAATNGAIEGNVSVSETYSIEVAITGSPPSNLISQGPNPIKTQTGITFNLGDDKSDIRFTVYNLLGQTVYRRTRGFFPKGENTIIYAPADDLSNGIYFFRISGDEVEINGKFTILR